MDLSPRRYHVASPQYLTQNARDASRTTEGPKQNEWEAVKEDVRSLYEQYPLKEVKRMLESRGFFATERMFKSRLSLWGFNKNSSDKEYQVALLQLQARKAEHKSATVFVINGNQRTVKDLRKYIKGRKMSDDQFLTLALENESAGLLKEIQKHVRSETPDPDCIDAEAKQSPDSAKTPSSLTSGNSPPLIKQAQPMLNTSSPPVSPSQLKLEALHDLSIPQSHSQSQYIPHSGHKSRRDSIKTRKKRFSESSMERATPLLAHIPDYRHHEMDEVQHNFLPVDPMNTYKASQYVHTGQPHDPNAEPLSGLEATQSYYTPRHSPTCEHFSESDVDMLAYSTVYSKPLASSYGRDNLDALKLLNPASSDPALDDYEVVCGKCHLATSTHFSSLQHVDDSPRSSNSLQQLPSRQSPRAILNPSAEVSSEAFQVAPSAKDHDHCFRWVSLCFLACIYSTKHQAFPHDVRAAHLADKALSDADGEFEAMLRSDDPKITLTLNHTLTILHMHDQKQICEKIMKSTGAVAERVVGLYHPAGIITRFLGYAGNPKKLREQREITSQTLRYVWDQYVQAYEAREKDMRSIGAMYCLGYMLNVEAGRDGDRDKLVESASIMRQCYQLSCEKLGRHDLQSIMAMTNLRLNMERQGKSKEAIACAETAIRDSETTLGTQHPKRLELMRNLARSYLEQGRDRDAERLYWKVLEGRINMLGRKHDFTQAMKITLTDFLKERGRWRNANGEASPEQLKIDDLFSWEVVDADSADEETADVMKAAQKQLKAY